MNIKDINPDKALDIGKAGENNAVSIDFDFSEWASKFGPGQINLIHQRRDDDHAYPVELAINGNVATWIVSNIDNAQPGTGLAELQYIADGVIAKSLKFATLTHESLTAGEDVPDAMEHWLVQLTEIAAETRVERIKGEAARDRAEQAAAAAEQKAAEIEATNTEALRIAESVRADADAGRFKGDKGDDGYTPVKGIDYFDGEKGEKGDPGQDYVITESDYEDIAEMVEGKYTVELGNVKKDLRSLGLVVENNMLCVEMED